MWSLVEVVALFGERKWKLNFIAKSIELFLCDGPSLMSNNKLDGWWYWTMAMGCCTSVPEGDRNDILREKKSSTLDFGVLLYLLRARNNFSDAQKHGWKSFATLPILHIRVPLIYEQPLVINCDCHLLITSILYKTW